MPELNTRLNIQLMSDLHMEVEDFDPEPIAGSDVLVLAGDIDSRWRGLEKFKSWPVPVIFVAGNHEFDRRDHVQAWPQLRELCEGLNIHLLEKQSLVLPAFPTVRFVGCTRWCDFDSLGVELRDKAMRSAKHYLHTAGMTHGGAVLDAEGVRQLGLASRRWLEDELKAPHIARQTVVITHFAPSVGSADPRYGLQPGTAGFCNADDDLMAMADLWLHGHLHCPSDYRRGSCRIVANPRGYVHKKETSGFQAQTLVSLALANRTTD